MPLLPTECPIPRAADVVVVGAGAAGAVVAARLSEAGSANVLLVEAGPDYRSADTPAAVRGADMARVLATRSLRWPGLRARPTERQPMRAYACGRGVGGGSAISGQLAVRGTRADFDAWVADSAGWSWPDVLPTFVHIEQDADFGGLPGHGSNGPVPVSRAPADRYGPVSTALHAAATDLGHAAHADLNADGGAGIFPAAWHRSDGNRVSSNDSYLEAGRDRPRLRIAGEHLVSRVLCASGRARGVELVCGRHREIVSAPAVVLCAGAVYSPAILLRSGVGPANRLRALGIEPVEDLPGVGAGLSDHPSVLLEFRLTNTAAARARAAESGCCLLRMRSTVDVSEDIQILPLDRTAFPAAAGLMVSLMRPTATGRLTLRGPDPAKDPVLDLRLLTERSDIDRLRAAVRQATELLDHPALRAVIEDGPVVPAGDLDRWLLANCRPLYHPSGTCRMGRPDDAGTVVDSEGRVLGVDGLWVADASVLPVPCGVPPYLTVVMVAERLAAVIGRRLRRAR